MSIFSELIPKIKEISNAYAKNFNDDLKVKTQTYILKFGRPFYKVL